MLLSYIPLIYAQQIKVLPDLDKTPILLEDVILQIEITSGIDDMYNFEFDRAESQFRWLKRRYPLHPLPYFLIALNHWWKILPNTSNTQYDNVFTDYLDSAIFFSKRLLKKNQEHIEATFFLAAAYGFKARFQGERKEWIKAFLSGRKAIKYLKYSQYKESLSTEFLFGHALYNYYAAWLKENYRSLRPFMWFFDKGNKKKGIQQLERVAHEAFYTRIEGKIYLMDMYDNEKKRLEALKIAKELHNKYPSNPCFHRSYARMLYLTGMRKDLEIVSLKILKNIENKIRGYEETSGRYGAFFLGNLYRNAGKKEKAICYLEKATRYAEKIHALNSGYYLLSLYYLGKFFENAKQWEKAKLYYTKLLERSDKKKFYHQKAKAFVKRYKKLPKKEN